MEYYILSLDRSHYSTSLDWGKPLQSSEHLLPHTSNTSDSKWLYPSPNHEPPTHCCCLMLSNPIPQCTCRAKLKKEKRKTGEERGERESHLTLTGMLMWAAMQLQWSIPLHSSTGAQPPRSPQSAACEEWAAQTRYGSLSLEITGTSFTIIQNHHFLLFGATSPFQHVYREKPWITQLTN